MSDYSHKNGAVLGNKYIDRAMIDQIKLGGFKHLKARTQDHLPENVAMLHEEVSPDLTFTVQLLDDWRMRPDGTFEGYKEYAEAQAARALGWYNVGVKRFQWSNEPNVLESWGPHAAWQWRRFTLDSVREFRRIMPRDIEIGLTPFGSRWDMHLNDYIRASVEAPTNDPQDTKPLATEFDFVCINAYGQGLLQMADAAYGRLDIGYRAQFRTHKLKHHFEYTEYGESSTDRALPFPAVYALQEAALPDFFATVAPLADIDYLDAFHLEGTSSWRGFRLQPGTLRKLAAL